MHRFRLIGVVGILLLLVLAGCGSADSNGGSAASDDGSAASDDGSAASDDGSAASDDGSADSDDGSSMTIRYSQPGASLSFASVLYAQAAGYFEEQGLTVQNAPFITNPPQIVNLLLTDGADIISNATTPIYQAYDRGLISVAMSGKGTTHALALTNDVVTRLAEQGVTPESPIKERISALKGLTLASVQPGSFVYQELVYALQQADLSVDDVDLSFVSDFGAAVASAKQGRVDGYLAPVPASFVGVAEEWSTIWLRANEFPIYRDANQTDIVTTADFAEKNPKAIEAFLRGLYQAQLDFRTDPAKVKSVLQDSEWFKETDPSLFELSIEETIPLYATEDFTPTEEAFENSYSLYTETRETEDEITFDQLYPETWREFGAQLFESEAWVSSSEDAPAAEGETE